MRPFPIDKVSYEVWYIDNVDTNVESWRMVPADTYAYAITVLESLTLDFRPGLRNTQYYVIEVSRRSVANQFNDFTNEGNNGRG